MRATEFRISNLVECFGTREVVAIKKNKIKVQHESKEGHFIIEWVPIDSLSIKLIPLTEEWLLKFGFEKVLNQYKKITDVSKDTFNNIPFIILFLGNQFQYDDLRFRTNLKYVHQLQNLYFALTGEELNIKEN